MIRIVFGLLLVLGCLAPAAAQDDPLPAIDLLAPSPPPDDPDFDLGRPGEDFTAPVPYAPPQEGVAGAAAPLQRQALSLEARLMDGGAPLQAGVTWRVFAAHPASDGKLPLVASARGGAAEVQLAPGEYVVHAAFGRAGATRRLTMSMEARAESLVLDAGGLQLDAIVGDEEPVRQDRLTFEVLQENDQGDLVTIVPKATPGRLLRLPAGTYHVISRYGDVNAVVRADIEVSPGKLTEAVMRHTGAEITLKLVSAEGGEAIANTEWTVLTQDGITLHESIGAFPSLVLAEGAYTAVAGHQNRIYSRDFAVEAGMNRDVEVRLTDFVPAQPGPESARQVEIYGAPMEP